MNETNHQCEICGKKLFKSGYLKQHMRTHFLQKDNYCRRCFKKFDNITVLKQHILEEHSPHVCEFCNKRFDVKASWESHVLKHKNAKPYQCDQCPKCYDHPDTLRTHREIKHDYIRYDCMYCDRQYTRKSVLYEHMKTSHSSENIILQLKGTSNPHGCTTCPRRFKDLNDLAEHVCQSELKYGCQKCSKRFNDMKELEQHRLEHPIRLESKRRKKKAIENGDAVEKRTINRKISEKVKCPHCIREIREINLEKHIKTHAPGYRKMQKNNPNATSCHLCDRKFTLMTCLKNHLKTHEPGYVRKPMYSLANPKSNICHICGRKFTRLGFLNRHLETHSQTGLSQVNNIYDRFQYNYSQMDTNSIEHSADSSYGAQ